MLLYSFRCLRRAVLSNSQGGHGGGGGERGSGWRGILQIGLNHGSAHTHAARHSRKDSGTHALNHADFSFCDNGSHELRQSPGALRAHSCLDLAFLSPRQHLIRACIELADTWCIRRPLLLVSRQSRTNRLQSDCSQANGFLSKRAQASVILTSREWSLARLISANVWAAARQARRPLWKPFGVLTSSNVVGGGPL